MQRRFLLASALTFLTLGAALPVTTLPVTAAQASPPQTTTACSETAHGRTINCPLPARNTPLPAGARNNAILSSTPASLAALVDTRTWTSGGGNTYPGADAPFGMIQWSPDTEPHRSDGGGYTYGDQRLLGYSLTHLSGPGCPAAGDVPILPMTGPLPHGDLNAHTTRFTNTGETAEAGYYEAKSNAPDIITSQFTATQHAAFGRFTFPRTADAAFLIKLRASEHADFAAGARVIGPAEIAGSVTSGDFCGETGKDGPQRYTVYFDLRFSRRFRPIKAGDDAVYVTFDTRADPVIMAKVAISYVSIANARLDRERALPAWDFSDYRTQAQREWTSLLSRIMVRGGAYALTQEFYSLLYKDFLQPNIISDVNGEYLGTDQKVHAIRTGQRDQYGLFSGWDIYHSLVQLQALLDPRAASDMAQSLVNDYAQNGILPQWGYLNLDNYVMVGDPADAVIAGYYAFGARHFTAGAALADMLRQATTVNRVRPGTSIEARLGYLPEGADYGCCQLRDVVSALLEYDTADFALSRFALALGHRAIAIRFRRRADNWTRVFDPANHLLVPRFADGRFVSGVRPSTDKYYAEGDAEEYLWDVPNDYAGLFSELGGARTVRKELTAYLSRPNAGGRHAFFSNEFDLGEQFAPDYAGDPAETQLAVSTIRQKLYRPGPFGLPNNDDLGAESSQFIWEMLGLYPENPGSPDLLLTSPGFPSAIIRLPSGRKITIDAPGASSQRYYVKSLTIDSRRYTRLCVSVRVIAGATLRWTLVNHPTSWGDNHSDAPPSYPPGS
jgi:predicted alpha-1,2-mannosidase